MQVRSDLVWLGVVLLFAWRRSKSPGKRRGPGGTQADKVPRKLSYAQLVELARAADMAEPETAAAIAMAESGGRTDAVGDRGDSIGLWQINLPTCPKQWANRDMLKHAGFNAQAASSMSNGGTDWNRWSTFRSRAYLSYLPKGR